METNHDVIVVGAGIVGLATAYELTRRGISVLVLERTAVAAEQSAGLVRIFRVLHGHARLCTLATEALHGWRRWEDELDAGRLVGAEGLVSFGPLIDAQAAAMRDAGADVREVSAGEARALVPVLERSGAATGRAASGSDSDAAETGAIVDPAAGVIRIRRAQAALAARLHIVPATVTALTDRGHDVELVLADDTRLHARHVVVCAGTATSAVAATAGIALEVAWSHHVRLTYGARDGTPLPPSAAFVLESAYGLPVGSTGRWALGLDDPGPPTPIIGHDADEYSATVRAQHARWLPTHMPALHPEPIDEVRCVSLDAPWLDARGDGFLAVRNGRVIACTGSNLMKFGPLLGDRLARSVLGAPDHVEEDLVPTHVAS